MWKNVHKSRPGHGQGLESAAILLSLPPWVALDERDMSIAPVLNSRLHNPPRLTSSYVQTGGLLLVLESIIKLLGKAMWRQHPVSSIPVRNACLRCSCVMQHA